MSDTCKRSQLIDEIKSRGDDISVAGMYFIVISSSILHTNV